MPKPYSTEMRQRVVSRVAAVETIREVASTFDVSVSAVVKLTQRYRATGSAAPAHFGGWRRATERCRRLCTPRVRASKKAVSPLNRTARW